MIYQVHNVCAEQGELLADVLSEQYGELADMYEESIETTELHRIDAMMSAWPSPICTCNHDSWYSDLVPRFTPLCLCVRGWVCTIAQPPRTSASCWTSGSS